MRSAEQTVPAPARQADLVQRVLDATQGIRFGSVRVTIHDGRIVQIERAEQFRPSPGSYLTSGDVNTHNMSFVDQTAGGQRRSEGVRNGQGSSSAVVDR